MTRPPGNEPYLRPYDRYEAITIRGRRFEVPAGQKVLRLFQHLSEAFELDVSRFCWNDDCHTCAFRFVDPQGRKRTALGCQKVAFEGMEILTVPGPIRVRQEAALDSEDPSETERGQVEPGS